MNPKTCAKCGKELTNPRKKYCNESCKYWYNQIKRDQEKHLPPVKKRNENYFQMATGWERVSSISRQGKRSGTMVKGAMSAILYSFRYEIKEVSEENVRKHFKGYNNQRPHYMQLGDDTIIFKEEVKQKLNIDL